MGDLIIVHSVIDHGPELRTLYENGKCLDDLVLFFRDQGVRIGGPKIKEAIIAAGGKMLSRSEVIKRAKPDCSRYLAFDADRIGRRRKRSERRNKPTPPETYA